MSARRPAKIQPKDFAFNADTLAEAKRLLTLYPEDRKASAVIPLLWIVQKQNDNWLSLASIRVVAEFLNMPELRVFEITTFYSMFNLSPVGKYFIQVCGTTPCLLAGSDEIINVCKNKIAAREDKISDNGKFSWLEVECLGACANAPMVQINDDYFEDLNANNFTSLLEALEAGNPIKAGPQNERFASEPLGGVTNLTEFCQDKTDSPNVTAALSKVGA